MSDTEWIYSLYIQANPVPDPGLLAETLEESQVVVLDRLPPDTAPARRLRRAGDHRPGWMIAVAAFAVAILIAAAASLIVLLGNERGEVIVVPPPVPMVSFDGETATYIGPETFDRSTLTFLFENTTGDMAGLGWNVMNDESITLGEEIAWMETHRGDTYEIPPWVEDFGGIGRFHTSGTLEVSAELPDGKILVYVWQPSPQILSPAAHITVDTAG